MRNKIALVLLSLTAYSTTDYAVPPYYKPQVIVSVKPSERDVKAIVVWKESRGESLATQKAVLEVVENRMRLFSMSAYDVVRQHGAFPWAKGRHTWKASQDQINQIDILAYEGVSVSHDTIYFNTTPHSFGKNTKRVGGLYFSE